MEVGDIDEDLALKEEEIHIFMKVYAENKCKANDLKAIVVFN